MRAKSIWLRTILVCTLGSAAIFAIAHWNDETFNVPSQVIAILGGLVCGCGGFVVSLILSPVIVKSDQVIQNRRKKMRVQQVQAGTNAASLLRAAECPPSQARVELLRPAQTGSTTAPEQLLRPVKTVEPRG